MIDKVQIACAAGATIGFSTWLYYHISIARELRQAKRETSRFPMFAARDRLIELVVDGKMSEADASWQRAYKGANYLLGIHHRLHLWDYISRYLKYLERMANDPDFRSRREAEGRQDAEAAERVPEFDDVCREIATSFKHMVEMRTSAWHRAMVVVFMLGFALIIVAARAGVKTAHAVSRKLRHPSDTDMGGWAAMDGCN